MFTWFEQLSLEIETWAWLEPARPGSHLGRVCQPHSSPPNGFLWPVKHKVRPRHVHIVPCTSEFKLMASVSTFICSPTCFLGYLLFSCFKWLNWMVSNILSFSLLVLVSLSPLKISKVEGLCFCWTELCGGLASCILIIILYLIFFTYVIFFLE